MAMNDTDLERIAAALSGIHGAFPIHNLVNYGDTVMVRPGARTTGNVVYSGIEIASRLPSEYIAYPLAVEYAAEDDGEDDLGEEVAAFGAEVVGASIKKTVRLRARYARITEKFRMRVRNVRGRGSKRDFRLATRALKRLNKIWARMGKVGINRGGLVPPPVLAAELRGARAMPIVRIRPARGVRFVQTAYPSTTPAAPTPVQPTVAPAVIAPTAAPPSVPAPVTPVVAPAAPAAPAAAAPAAPTSTYTPVSKQISKLYLADQAALERELQATTPSYYGATDYLTGQEELAADLRAETIGYLFGAMEHDYFGVGGVGPVEFTSSDFTAMFSGGCGCRMAEAFGDDLLYGTPAGPLVDTLEGVLQAHRLEYAADELEDIDPVMSALLRREASNSHNAVELARLGLEEDAEDEGDEVDADESESDEDAEESEPKQKADTEKSDALDEKQAKTANRQRRAALPSMTEMRAVREGGNPLEAADRAAKIVSRVTEALRSISPNGSVNYARLQPRTGSSKAEPVIVIGIAKRGGKSKVDLVSELLEEEVPAVPKGYDAAEAVDAMMAFTHPSDYTEVAVQGSRSLLESLVAPMSSVEDCLYGPVLYGAGNRYPVGSEAPLPPPRRVGAEVYGA